MAADISVAVKVRSIFLNRNQCCGSDDTPCNSMPDAKNLASHVKIRLPDGSVLENVWDSSTLLSEVNDWVCDQIGEKNLLLSISHPRKVYEKLEQERTTLSDVPGTFPTSFPSLFDGTRC